MPDRLDTALRDLARELAFPPTPDLHAAVVAGIHEPPPQSWSRHAWPRSFALATIALLLVVAATAAAVLVLPGLRITLVPSLPTASVPADGLANRLALGERVQLSSVDARVPGLLGEPDEVYSAGDGEVVSLVYHSGGELRELAGTGIGLLVQQINGALERDRIEKLVPEFGVAVTPVRVDGADGFWITGPPHLTRYLDASGAERAEMTRLVGDTLVWQRGGVLYRIESGLGLAETRRIAESIDD